MRDNQLGLNFLFTSQSRGITTSYYYYYASGSLQSQAHIEIRAEQIEDEE